MNWQPVVTGILLALAVGLALLCSLGLAVMRDPWQRLQFTTPVVAWSAGLIAVAVWLAEGDWQARIKVLLVAGLLFVMNAILASATARAARIRRAGRWPLHRDENVPIVGDDGSTGDNP